MSEEIDKKSLSETDIRTKFITPAITEGNPPGWDVMTQLREEVFFTNGKIIVRGKTVKRGKANKADYILYFKPNIPLAIVEAKDNNHGVGDGMQQALQYADILDLPFVYSSNGDGFLEHDRTENADPVERELPLNQFPHPNELWRRYCQAKGLSAQEEEIAAFDYHLDGSGKEPRYYQRIAINRTIEAIAKGQNRILLVMATGTGKTYTAFQIIWRLWKSGAKKRILFLADRNILVDQTRINDFKPFGKAMTKITNRSVDKAFEVYLALYQAISGTESAKNIYKEFSPDFFDLIVIDECHRGSAADDATWREILEHFSPATQIGMTATPKETKYASNIHYFGSPLYTYSLKQGIADGFLAPYKVVRIDLDRDLTGWRPEKGKRDKAGHLIDDKIYRQKDFDRKLILERRTRLVAEKVTEFLKATDRYAKTIVFCEDIDHAERMRMELVNCNADLAADNSKYIMRITGDNDEGKAQLDNFIDPESTYPVIAVTSRLMSTGVDAQTCKLIVLDRGINSMTEFKQIIGRGTRVNEEYDKMYFTIMDFRRVTELFADPEFDGEPVQIYEPKEGEPPVPPEEDPGREGEPGGTVITDPGLPPGPGPLPPGGAGGPKKFTVGDVTVTVVSERVQYYDGDGNLITESLKDYTRKQVQKNYDSLDTFLTGWKDSDRRQAIIEELSEQGLFLEELAREVGREYSPFDLICHVAFDQRPLTRKERAEKLRAKDVFEKYGGPARLVLEALLDKYADSRIDSLEDLETLKVDPLTDFGTPIEIIEMFGGRDGYLKAVHEIESGLYETAPPTSYK